MVYGRSRDAYHRPGDITAVPQSVNNAGVSIHVAVKGKNVYLQIGGSTYNFSVSEALANVQRIKHKYPSGVPFNIVAGGVNIKGTQPADEGLLKSLSGYFGVNGNLRGQSSSVDVKMDYRFGELRGILGGFDGQKYTGVLDGDYLERLLANPETNPTFVLGVYGDQSAYVERAGSLANFEFDTKTLLNGLGDSEGSLIQGNLTALVHSRVIPHQNVKWLLKSNSVPSRIKIYSTCDALPDFSKRPVHTAGLSFSDLLRLSQLARPDDQSLAGANTELNYLERIEETFGLTRLGLIKKRLTDLLVRKGSLQSERGYFENYSSLLGKYS